MCRIYPEPLKTFALVLPEATKTKTVPVLAEGGAALVKISDELGLGMDAEDIAFYTKLFTDMGSPMRYRHRVRVRVCVRVRVALPEPLGRHSHNHEHRTTRGPCGRLAAQAVTRRRWSALTWASPTRSTAAIGSSGCAAPCLRLSLTF